MKIHVRIQDKTYQVELGDINARPIQAEVDGENFEVWPQEVLVPGPEQRPAPQPQTAHPVKPVPSADEKSKASAVGQSVLAPIPGVIIEICVEEGTAVEYGQELCILEAMKMKNSIRANQAATVEKILVSVGQQVSQSQELITFRKGG